MYNYKVLKDKLCCCGKQSEAVGSSLVATASPLYSRARARTHTIHHTSFPKQPLGGSIATVENYWCGDQGGPPKRG